MRMTTKEKIGTSKNTAERQRQSMKLKKLLALLHSISTMTVIGKRQSNLQTKAHEHILKSPRIALNVLVKILCMYVVCYRVIQPSMAQKTLQVSLENMYK